MHTQATEPIGRLCVTHTEAGGAGITQSSIKSWPSWPMRQVKLWTTYHSESCMIFASELLLSLVLCITFATLRESKYPYKFFHKTQKGTIHFPPSLLRHETISKEVWLRWSKSIMTGISWNLVSSPERLKDSSGPNFSQFRPKARIWGFCVPAWSQQTPWRWCTPWRGSCPGRSFTRSWEGPKLK